MSRAILLIPLIGLCQGSTNDSHEGESHGDEERIHLAGWNWHHVGIYLTIILFILLSGMAKVVFHKLHWLSSRVPESCLLVLVGTLMGLILFLTEKDKDHDSYIPQFTPDLFFFALLPPIILESAYNLYDRVFFDNLATILLMAVIGTTLNFFLIGSLLSAVFNIGAMGEIRGLANNSTEGYPLSIFEILLFAALISAVDPVAVLAIFEEVGVNPALYFLVFGESLLNDGVAVVFYKTMNTLNTINSSGVDIEATQYLLGFLSFFTVALGGLFVGIFVGLISALITRTTRDVRVMEPLAIIGTAALAYFGAELFHWSGIISLIGCGLTQKHYTFKNVSEKSRTTVTYFVKMASSTSDIVIFLFLGKALVSKQHVWHTGFVVWTISFCLICRFFSVYGLVWIANRYRIKKINLQEQFIMAYGGLRGAVGFSLVVMISEDVKPRQMFITTTLAVTMFTIFFQGTTIKFLVDLLNIDKKKEEQKLIAEEVNDNLIEHIVSGIDIISGQKGRYYLQNLFEYYDEHYFMKIFCNQENHNELTHLFEKLALSDHLLNLYGPTLVHEEGQGKLLLKPVKPADLMFGVGESEDERLLRHPDAENPPPLPPKNMRNGPRRNVLVRSISSGFRQRGKSDATALRNLSKSKRRSGEADLARAALESFRLNSKRSMNRTLGRHDVAEHMEHELLLNHYKERHAKARRISQVVLKKQRTSANEDVVDDDDSYHRTRHLSMHDSRHQREAVEDEDVFVGLSSAERLGLRAVLRLHNERRMRSYSTSSSRTSMDPTYSNINEVRRRSAQRPNSMADIEEVTTTADMETSKTTTSPVERKKNAPSGRRKLTPHPLNPNNASTVNEAPTIHTSSGTNTTTVDSKLTILAEDEEHCSTKSDAS